MNNVRIYEEFLKCARRFGTNNVNHAILQIAFSDLDKILLFNKMDGTDRRQLFNRLASISKKAPPMSKKDIDRYFSAMTAFQEISKTLRSRQLSWGMCQELYDPLRELTVKSRFILKLKAEFTKAGRPNAINLVQKNAILSIMEILKINSSKNKKIWSDLRIKKFGIFVRSHNSAGKNEKAKDFSGFKANPARLLSNFSYGVGVDLSEKTILDLYVKKMTNKS